MNTETPDALYAHLGPFSDLVAAARALRPLFPSAPSGLETRRRAREVLRFTVGEEQPRNVSTERNWRADGVDGVEISWSVGFGPRTRAWILKPAGSSGSLPGVVALHDHGHFKYFGKEKIADGPEGPLSQVKEFRDTYYGGRAYANLLAREGFVVLVHDTFLWGSRRFPLEIIPETDRALAEPVGAIFGQESAGPEVVRYNGAAYLHEHLVSKYCTLLGTNVAAIVAYEDRVALNYIRAREDVDAGRVGCVGLSGGGLRAALLRATSDHLAACAIVGMMSTYEGLLDNCVAPHTWMLFPTGWSTHGDWPDLASSAAPAPLLVQYLLDDAQFTVAGMRGADVRMAACYERAGAAEAYRGEFYPGPHRFDAPMQQAAISWLLKRLQP
jgi:dienelactone hydrolase